MPVDFMPYVTGSTLQDMTHKGPLQAGNKSMLSYRSDLGIPGYTGFIPNSAALLLPTKGSTVHTGRGGDAALQNELAKLTLTRGHKESEYTDRYRATPSRYRRPTKEGGGYWIDSRVVTTGPAFTAKTTYQAEVQQAESTAAAQLGATAGLNSLVVGYEAARQRAQSAEPMQRSMRGTQRYDNPPIFQTTYNAMVVPNPLTGGAAAAGAPRRPVTAVEFRYSVLPHVMAPTFDGASTYTQNFGADGSDPQERSAPHEAFQSRMATTSELAEGTRRNTHQLPGYTGFVPASKYAGAGAAHANAESTRPNFKNDMLLYHLDQYSRQRLPLYTGYKPQAGAGATTEQPGQGPTAETTYGAGNEEMLTKRPFPRETSSNINSRAGLMTFFTSGKESESSNGLANAQQYYKTLRPAEGVLKVGSPNKATAYGAKFKAGNSIV